LRGKYITTEEIIKMLFRKDMIEFKTKMESQAKAFKENEYKEREKLFEQNHMQN